MANIIQNKRGTATQWSTLNPLLAAGEIGFETDTGRFKIGDSFSYWNSLSYSAPNVINELTDVQISNPTSGQILVYDSILGKWKNISSSANVGWGAITGTLSDQTDLQNALNSKQDTLASGTNIKTINGSSILGSGNLDTPYRNIGEKVQSTIPLTDAGLHLLDGALLTYGSYQAFIDYIANLYDENKLYEWTRVSIQADPAKIYTKSSTPQVGDTVYDVNGNTLGTVEQISSQNGNPKYNGYYYENPTENTTPRGIFTTEANWQTSVSTYGVCGKFVYDSVNNTVRLPKRTQKHGDLIYTWKSGASWCRIYEDGWCEQGGTTSSGDWTQVTLHKPYIDTNYTLIAGSTEADRDGKTCSCAINSKATDSFWIGNYHSGTAYAYSMWYASGYVSISSYQKETIYEYIVIATSTKTVIEVDIDEIATDLNGKADVDFSNANPNQTFIDTSMDWLMPDYSSAMDISSTVTTSSTQNRNYPYPILVCVKCRDNNVAGGYVQIICEGMYLGQGNYNYNSVPTTVPIPANTNFQLYYVQAPNNLGEAYIIPLKGGNY